MKNAEREKTLIFKSYFLSSVSCSVLFPLEFMVNWLKSKKSTKKCPDCELYYSWPKRYFQIWQVFALYSFFVVEHTTLLFSSYIKLVILLAHLITCLLERRSPKSAERDRCRALGTRLVSYSEDKMACEERDPAPLKLVVFGGNGLTGKEVVKQALEKGYSVTSVVRSPEKVEIRYDAHFQGCTHPIIMYVQQEL